MKREGIIKTFLGEINYKIGSSGFGNNIEFEIDGTIIILPLCEQDNRIYDIMNYMINGKDKKVDILWKRLILLNTNKSICKKCNNKINNNYKSLADYLSNCIVSYTGHTKMLNDLLYQWMTYDICPFCGSKYDLDKIDYFDLLNYVPKNKNNNRNCEEEAYDYLIHNCTGWDVYNDRLYMNIKNNNFKVLYLNKRSVLFNMNNGLSSIYNKSIHEEIPDYIFSNIESHLIGFDSMIYIMHNNKYIAMGFINGGYTYVMQKDNIIFINLSLNLDLKELLNENDIYSISKKISDFYNYSTCLKCNYPRFMENYYCINCKSDEYIDESNIIIRNIK